MNSKKTPFILYGGDYNPEQWDEATIEQDMQLFKKAGINLVTLPVFAWAKLEPREGEYHFEWLDKILQKLLENKIYVILATPTSAQPAWLSKNYPEVLPVDIAGRKRTHGMRVFFCVNSEKYLERSAAMATEMAKRYGDYPGLIGWHVANEYGTYCYCDNCQKKFRIWLKNRYKTIENLNEKWNTCFWGRIVYDFEEIMLPTELNDDYRFNPGVQLDYMRFVTDSTLDCYLNEANILKSKTPDLPIFSNISGFIKKLNQFKLVEHMDCAAWDNYPGPMDDRSLPALKHDIMRALKDGESYIIAEQSPNQQNWQPYNKLKRPGEVRTIAYQGIARGADACLFFQMRQSVGGQEKFHGAVISHAGRDDTRIYREISELGHELQKLGDSFLGGKIESKVAIMFDWDSWWALELTSGPTQDMDYLEQVNKYYKTFYDKNIPVDIAKVTADLSKYKIVVAPLLYMMKPGVAKRIEEFTANGGIFIATYMTGVADENDRCIFGAAPGELSETLGLWVEETDAMYPDEKNTIIVDRSRLPIKDVYTAGFLCDVIRTTTAEPIAVYGGNFYKGTPCITANKRGLGKAYYIGCEPQAEFLADFIGNICEESGIVPLFETCGEIELSTRIGKDSDITFVINHGDTEGQLKLGQEQYINLLNDEIITGTYQMNGRDVIIIRRK